MTQMPAPGAFAGAQKMPAISAPVGSASSNSSQKQPLIQSGDQRSSPSQPRTKSSVGEKVGCMTRLMDCLRTSCGRLLLPCMTWGNQTDLERNRIEFAMTASAITGQRRTSFAAAAGAAIKAFEEADKDHSHTLDANELLQLEGMESSARKRLEKLLLVFDDGFKDHEGMDLSHFKEMHYRMNKKCQVMMKEGESSAAKGELLMLYTVVDYLEEKVSKLEKQLHAKEAVESAAQECIEHMRDIEKAAAKTRELMRKATSSAAIQANAAKSSGKLAQMF